MFGNNVKRTNGVSLLDYLWTHFGQYKVSEGITDSPESNNIVTEKVLSDYLKEFGGVDGVVKLQISEQDNKLLLQGVAINGQILTTVELDSENYLVDVLKTVSTQQEVDLGVSLYLNEPLIVFTMKNGTKYYISEGQSIDPDENNLLSRSEDGLLVQLNWEEYG